MPLDDLVERLDHREATHPRVLEHRPRRVAQPEPAHEHVEIGAGQLPQGQRAISSSATVNMLDMRKSSPSLTS